MGYPPPAQPPAAQPQYPPQQPPAQQQPAYPAQPQPQQPAQPQPAAQPKPRKPRAPRGPLFGGDGIGGAPPLVGQLLLVFGLLLALLGSAIPAMGARSGAAAREAAAGYASYIEQRVAKFQAEVDATPIPEGADVVATRAAQAKQVDAYRTQLETELDLEGKRREAAQSALAGTPGGGTLLLGYVGLLLFSIGSLMLVLRSTGMARGVYVGALVLGLWAGGVGLNQPGASTLSAAPRHARRPPPATEEDTPAAVEPVAPVEPVEEQCPPELAEMEEVVMELVKMFEENEGDMKNLDFEKLIELQARAQEIEQRLDPESLQGKCKEELEAIGERIKAAQKKPEG